MGGDLQIYFCVLFRETRHHAQAHVQYGALVHCALSLAARRKQMAAQLGWRFRWPLFVMVTSADACCCFCCCCSSSSSSSSSSKYSSTLLVTAPDSGSVSATRISLMASSSSFILFSYLFFFFLAIAWDPQSSASFRLLCMSGHNCRNVIPVQYECLLQWQQNRSKAMMWLLYKIPAIQGCPRHCY